MRRRLLTFSEIIRGWDERRSMERKDRNLRAPDESYPKAA